MTIIVLAGLGAQKATKKFADIEAEAELADNIATTRKEEVRGQIEIEK